MIKILNNIKSSEFLSFSEVLRLKVAIVTLFIIAMVLIAIPTSSFNEFEIQADVIIPLVLLAFIILTIIFLVVNLNRLAMHFSIFTVMIMLIYFTMGSSQFYGYIIFFVTLTILIFYQDIATYFLYGLIVTGYGIYYVFFNGVAIIGVNSLDHSISMYSYIIILSGFYIMFLIQFIVSDNIYSNMNEEWVRMSKLLDRYHSSTTSHINEFKEKNDIEFTYKNKKFQQTVNEIAVFINEFFEQDAENIAEVVEYYFFLHDQDLDEVINNNELPSQARKYATQLSKYLIDKDSELTSLLYDFSTMFIGDGKYNVSRYEYSLEELFDDRTDKILALAIIYKFIKTELSQKDKWGMISKALTHDEITELFTSKEFREFITYEQVNFYLDNEELFDKYL